MARTLLALAAVALLFPSTARPAAAKVVVKSQPGFTVEIALPAKSADEDAERALKIAQAMYEQFRTGKHPFHGFDDLLDLSEPGKAARPKGHEVAIGFSQVDRDCLKALVGAGFRVRMFRLHTTRKPSGEMSERISASFLLAQTYGGPLKDLTAAEGMEKGVPASLLVTLDGVLPSNVVWILRLKSHVAAIADAKEKVLIDESTSPEDQSRARLVARVWNSILHGWPFGRELLEGIAHLGAAASGLVELMARGCSPELFKEFLATATAVLRGKELAPSVDELKRYGARAYDLPTPEALLAAISDGDAERVRVLLKAGAPATAKDKEGETALQMAIGEEKPEIARLLADTGADFSVTDRDGRSPLELAVWKKQGALVKYLAPKADLRGKSKSSGEKCLIDALHSGEVVSAQALLEAGVDPDARDPKDTPGVVLAAQSAKAEALVDLLLKVKVTLNVSDKEGTTALMVAAEQGKTELVKTLVARGAYAWATNKRDKTAADLAEIAGYPAIAAELKKQPKRK